MAKKQLAFAAGDYIVYPSHGVGRITGIETQTIAGLELELYVKKNKKKKKKKKNKRKKKKKKKGCRTRPSSIRFLEASAGTTTTEFLRFTMTRITNQKSTVVSQQQ